MSDLGVELTELRGPRRRSGSGADSQTDSKTRARETQGAVTNDLTASAAATHPVSATAARPDTVGIAPLSDTLRRHMQGLNQSPDGRSLHRLLKTGLARFGANGVAASASKNAGAAATAPVTNPATNPVTNEACIAYLHSQLFSFVADNKKDPVTRIRARLLQHHLAAWLPERIPAAVTPALEHHPEAELLPREARDAAREPAVSNGHGAVRAGGDAPQRAEPRIDSMLRTEQDAWQTVYGTIRDFNELKKTWADNLDELVRERAQLTRKLDDTEAALAAAHDEGQSMRAEIERLKKVEKQPARARAATRAAAGKSARRAVAVLKQDAFVRYLETEIARARRRQSPYAIAVIEIEDASGNELTATEVARCYTNEVLTSFRAYDLVAQLDDVRFAILFPDTDTPGAQRALEKARKRATEMRIAERGRTLRIPPFRAVLSVPVDGEDAAAALARLRGALGSSDAADTSPIRLLLQ